MISLNVLSSSLLVASSLLLALLTGMAALALSTAARMLAEGLVS